MQRCLYKRVKTKDGFTDFKHHVDSWRRSKQLRQQCRRKKLKLSSQELQELYVEMIENEEINKEVKLYCEHENAGDRE